MFQLSISAVKMIVHFVVHILYVLYKNINIHLKKTEYNIGALEIIPA